MQVLDSKVVVHSIRITEKAESKVERLAERTGGFKTYSDGNSATELIDDFNELIDSAIDGIIKKNGYFIIIFTYT